MRRIFLIAAAENSRSLPKFPTLATKQALASLASRLLPARQYYQQLCL